MKGATVCPDCGSESVEGTHEVEMDSGVAQHKQMACADCQTEFDFGIVNYPGGSYEVVVRSTDGVCRVCDDRAECATTRIGHETQHWCCQHLPAHHRRSIGLL
jgi:hypothetical protein